MEEQTALKTENLALKREVTRLNNVIDLLTRHLVDSFHEMSAILCDTKCSTRNSHQNDSR